MSAVFVLPTSVKGQLGPVAAYLSTAGWAAAAQRVLGRSWIIGPTGEIDPAEARRIGTDPSFTSDPTTTRSRYARVPGVAKTLAKDVRQYRRAQAFHVDPDGPWTGHDVEFVWQRHELFATAGLDLAKVLGRPSVVFAPATKVWESNRWGTTRPGWGRLVERWGERPVLTAADVLACGSAEVAEHAVRMGVHEARIIVTPTGVDLDLFEASVAEREHRRTELGLQGRFVVGWVGSFRPFHSIDQAVRAVAGLPGASLLLVGDGPQRPEIEDLAARLDVHLVCTGTVAHHQLPALLSAMDVGLVLAPADGAFHSSPLKLGEYLAAGLPVIAPAVETVTSRLTNGVNALLVEPNDLPELRNALERLRADPELAARLGVQARQEAVARWSWDEQVRRVRNAAGMVSPS